MASTSHGLFVSPTDTALSESLLHQTFRFHSLHYSWEPDTTRDNGFMPEDAIDRLVVASYNLSTDSPWPSDSSRYAVLTDNLLSSRAAADVLVLQQATGQFLEYLLANQRIRSKYMYSTHAPSNQIDGGSFHKLPSIVVLSKFPLRRVSIPLEIHNSTLVVTCPSLQDFGPIGIGQRPLIITACHLCQGFGDAAIKIRKLELERLLAYLSDTYGAHAMIIAGGFNEMTSSQTINKANDRLKLSAMSATHLHSMDLIFSEAHLQDAWLMSRIQSGERSMISWRGDQACEGEEGATYYPPSSQEACKLGVSGLSERPQRYDRILVNDLLQLRPQHFNTFGFGLIPVDETTDPAHASDHRGIRCLLQRTQYGEPGSFSISHARDMAVDLHQAPQTLAGHCDVQKSLMGCHSLPKDVDLATRLDALELLGDILHCRRWDMEEIETSQEPNMVLVPVGSHGLGVSTPVSTVECVCIGDISSATFLRLAAQRLRRASFQDVIISRKVTSNTGTHLLISVRSIKFDVQYCSAASIVARFPDVMRRPSDDAVFVVPSHTLLKLKPVRDLYYLRNSIPDTAQYRIAHLFIVAWARSRGIYGARFGLLRDIQISVMLVHVHKTLASVRGSFSTADLLMSFFKHYDGFDWAGRMVYDPFFRKNMKYHRTFRERLCLLGWHTPSINTASNTSLSTVKALSNEMSRASSLLSQPGMTWSHFLNHGHAYSSYSKGPADSASAEFLRAYETYIRIDAHVWGSSPAKLDRFMSWTEARCITFLVELERQFPSLIHRLWPQRFVDELLKDGAEQGPECRCCYFIGLDWQEHNVRTPPLAGAGIADPALYTSTKQLELSILSDEKHYDANCCWVNVTLVPQNRLDALYSDHRDFGDQYDHQWTESDEELNADDDEHDDGEDDADRPPSEGQGQPSFTKHRHEKKLQNRNILTAEDHARAGKLRPASDVMNRLRWDPDLNVADYIVGYEDRFIGICERPLDMWKGEQTDEEFIPQHRIVYFKRNSDGEVVWDRRSRQDQIFESSR